MQGELAHPVSASFFTWKWRITIFSSPELTLECLLLQMEKLKPQEIDRKELTDGALMEQRNDMTPPGFNYLEEEPQASWLQVKLFSLWCLKYHILHYNACCYH